MAIFLRQMVRYWHNLNVNMSDFLTMSPSGLDSLVVIVSLMCLYLLALPYLTNASGMFILLVP